MYKLIISLIFIFSLVACDSKPISTVDDSRGEKIVDITEKPWRFADYQGQWIIVNYWASWCKPCITEVPELEAFYKSHLNKDAIVLGVNFDFYNKEDTIALAKKYGMTYPVLTSENDPRAQLGVEPIMVLPTTFIINPEGQVVHKLIGEQTQAGLEKRMEK